MSKECCEIETTSKPKNEKQKVILWISLILNASMFIVEIIYSYLAQSVSLKADAIDFLGDAANYGLSIFVLNMTLQKKAKASFVKSASMGLFGFWVIGSTIYYFVTKSQPEAETMSVVGVAAFFVNLLVAGLLYQFRDGDSNMKSVWLCTRNDVIGNLAVILAAGGIIATKSNWPDLVVALGMGLLAIQSAWLVFADARREIKIAN